MIAGVDPGVDLADQETALVRASRMSAAARRSRTPSPPSCA
jgi:hypothetical protein